MDQASYRHSPLWYFIRHNLQPRRPGHRQHDVATAANRAQRPSEANPTRRRRSHSTGPHCPCFRWNPTHELTDPGGEGWDRIDLVARERVLVSQQSVLYTILSSSPERAHALRLQHVPRAQPVGRNTLIWLVCGIRPSTPWAMALALSRGIFAAGSDFSQHSDLQAQGSDAGDSPLRTSGEA